MNSCKICSHDCKEIISFGKMPVANHLLADPNTEESFYNMSVAFCPACYMVQLVDTVSPEVMFNDNYSFISSSSNRMAAHFKSISGEITSAVKDKKNPFVVELGCNDGIMLKNIAANGIQHLGVEPSDNVAQLAIQNNVNVAKEFFNEALAQKIVQQYGQADFICGSNVFNHIEDLNSVLKGIAILLKEDGTCFIEDPYIFDIIQKKSFDQIYDEHIYFFSGLSVNDLAQKFNMQLVDMAHQDVHGGSMRYYIKKGASNPISANVNNFILQEKQAALDSIHGYVEFKDHVNNICSELKKLLTRLKKEGHRIVGYGATAKSSTLLNYAQIGPDLIDYISDTTPNKINQYTPGTHIPIKSYETFLNDNVSYVLLLAWNHKEEIYEKEKQFRKNNGKFIIYFPRVVIE